MKIIEWLIELFYWCIIFLCPTVILGFAGFLIYYNHKDNLGVFSFAALSVAGIAAGIYFAEKIRRTIGCSMFITRNNWSDYSKKGEIKQDKN